ncbi:MAG: hypothetical protein ABIL76_01775 [candidate division WOR-3 bacterium]
MKIKFFHLPTLILGYKYPVDLSKEKLYPAIKSAGPYQPLKNEVRGAIISKKIEEDIESFKNYFEAEFKGLFKKEIKLDIRQKLDNIGNYQIIIWVVCDESDYINAKNQKRISKVPIQIVRKEKINSNNKGYNFLISNLCLNVYCKLGFIPWIIEPNYDAYVVGIKKKKRNNNFVYFVKVFKNDGYLVFKDGPSSNFKELLSKIPRYTNKFSFHFSVKPSNDEISAIEENFRIYKYAIIYINLYSNFLMFDLRNEWYMPESGYFIRLSGNRGLILSDGLFNSKRSKPGFPKVLDVNILKSKINFNEYEKLFEQIYHFRYVNYKSFFSFPSIPAEIT